VNNPVTIFWFRRDLRLYDNNGLFQALKSGLKVLPIFIFDINIVSKLHPDDKRVSFIYQAIEKLNLELRKYNTIIRIYHGYPVEVLAKIIDNHTVKSVIANSDYEPYSIERDNQVDFLLKGKGIEFKTCKDHVIFEKDEILKISAAPCTVFTPYSKKWIEKYRVSNAFDRYWNSEDYLDNFLKTDEKNQITLQKIGFNETNALITSYNYDEKKLLKYHETRNFPAMDSTSRAGVHLRFGTLSIRKIASYAFKQNITLLNELIWREFFMQILWHFPHVIHQPFKPKYKFINWINNESEFNDWSSGNTGYPLVDAGMRELNETGFMHNRVRMVAASYLVKHLLINWQWGEAYFAGKLLDYELSSNNGNWQWVAGTGCDAAPYFRIFNPVTQAEKFDSAKEYIKKWVPEFESSSYRKPPMSHAEARSRCLLAYKACL